MIGFYLSKAGNYNPSDVSDPSSSLIFDYKNKTVEVMTDYLFDFQKLSDAYKNDVPAGVDVSKHALSLAAARTLYTELNQTDQAINSSINRIESSLGVANGIATLDGAGLIPSSQLPSYVDDVLEYNSSTNFPNDGSAGKIYVALDDNLTYRWGGTTYVEISKSLALGETSSTAYAGDKGKQLKDAFDLHVIDTSAHVRDASATAWNTAATNSHTHANKSLLDEISSADITNWNDASAKRHTHSNKAILDGITDTSVADWLRDTSYGQGTLAELQTGTSTTPKVWDASVINAYLQYVDANAVRYKGDINASTGAIVDTSDTLTTVSNKKGDLYIVSTAGTYLGVELQVGDSIIFKKNVTKNTAPVATDISFVQGTVKVFNHNAILYWDTSTMIASVEGVEIYVRMPENPNTDTSYLTGTSGDLSTGTSTVPKVWGAKTIVDYVNGRDFGSVKSVQMSVPTGLTVTGGPITESGTLAVSLTDGYQIPKNASMDNFQRAYSWGDHALVGYATNSSVSNNYVTNSSVQNNYVQLSTYNTKIPEIELDIFDTSTLVKAVNSSTSQKIVFIDASLLEIYEMHFQAQLVQAAAWNQLKSRNPGLNMPDSSLIS